MFCCTQVTLQGVLSILPITNRLASSPLGVWLRPALIFRHDLPAYPEFCTIDGAYTKGLAKGHLDKPESFWKGSSYYLVTTTGKKKEHSIPGEEPVPYCKIWWRVHHAVGMCGKNSYCNPCQS